MPTCAIATHTHAHHSYESQTHIHSMWYPETTVGTRDSILLRPLGEYVQYAPESSCPGAKEAGLFTHQLPPVTG